MKAIDFRVYDIVKDSDFEGTDVYSLTPELYEKAISIGKEFEPVLLDIDTFSKIGFIISVVDNISIYVIRYEDLMLTPIFDEVSNEVCGFSVLNGVGYNTLTGKPELDYCVFTKPVKYMHELQALLRVGGYEVFANKIKL